MKGPENEQLMRMYEVGKGGVYIVYSFVCDPPEATCPRVDVIRVFSYLIKGFYVRLS